MQKRTLIFDFDGTIADTHLFIIDIYNSFSDDFGYKRIDVRKLERYKDKNAQQIIRHLKIPIFKIPSLITKAKMLYHQDIHKIKPFDGLKEVLEKLKAAGHTLGILSSNSRPNIMKFLDNHHLQVFDFIQSTSSVLGKNSAIKKLAERMNINLNDILYIGDEVRDIEAAKKLGIKVAAVTWGYNSLRALKARKPDFLIHHPKELLLLCR
ncbi:MAG TPA: HAD-IA family hydrolase [Candidatus Omnitrophota bacterium]|nr:HAD-IA family hydrolase [Candidatus Omnitrophota bacterium]